MAKHFQLTPAEQFELHQLLLTNQESKEEVTHALSRVWDIYMAFRARINGDFPASVDRLDLEMMRDMRHVFEPLVTFH